MNRILTVRHWSALVAVCGAVLQAPAVLADPALRHQMDLGGDFLLIGNTLTQECAQGTPAPVVGTIGNCPNNNLLAPDVYWQADGGAGTAQADNAITVEQSSSAAVLQLPAGALVEYARLYWGGYRTVGEADLSVRLSRGDGSFDENIAADDSVVVPRPNANNQFLYQSTADVSQLVAANSSGAYQISGVASELTSLDTSVAAWYMVVFYKLSGSPTRNLAIFDGLDYVDPNNPSSASLSGFLVPNAGFDAKLGVVAYEGENQYSGDQLSFNGTVLSDALNPADDFFNATHSSLGVAVSEAGDLPQLSGEPGSLSNIDLDVVDVTSLVAAGQTSATIETSSTLDIFLLSAFVTSITTYIPDFATSTKSSIDINGGDVERGDTLTYAITVINNGSDASENTILTDPLPEGVTFVPGSISIVSGANSGDKTDAVDSDQAEYVDATRTVTVRLGAGADGTQGGTMEIGDETSIIFQVTIDQDATGDISNQAFIDFSGRRGAPATQTATDSNVTSPGQAPTVVSVACMSDSDCAAPTPHCDPSGDAPRCVECVNSAQCTDTNAPDCNPDTQRCECASADGVCVDSDGDGISDDAEKDLGTDPADADTDDDGVPDGAEIGPNRDSDGDGIPNVEDPDSDNDGIFDGTELGYGCDDPSTDLSAGHCVPDADMGKTTTNPVKADTDGGSVDDGVEDANHNGRIDSGETDPNDPSDDVPAESCSKDADCTDQICVSGECIDGCRPGRASTCGANEECVRSTGMVGECKALVDMGSDGGTPPSGDAKGKNGKTPGSFGGGGCSCTIAQRGARHELMTALLIGLSIIFATHRRRRG